MDTIPQLAFKKWYLFQEIAASSLFEVRSWKFVQRCMDRVYLCIYVCMYLYMYVCSNVDICGHVVPSTNLTNPVQPWEPNRSLHTSAGNGTNSQNWSPTFSKGPYIKRRLLIVDSWFVSITRWISIGWSSAWSTWLKQANIYHLCNFQLTWAPRSTSQKFVALGTFSGLESLDAKEYPNPIPTPRGGRKAPIQVTVCTSLRLWDHSSHSAHHTSVDQNLEPHPWQGAAPPIQLGGVDIQNCGTYPRLGKYPVFESCVGRYATWLATPNEYSNQLLVVSWSPCQWGISRRVPVCVSTCFNLVILGPSSLSTKLSIQKPIA